MTQIGRLYAEEMREALLQKEEENEATLQKLKAENAENVQKLKAENAENMQKLKAENKKATSRLENSITQAIVNLFGKGFTAGGTPAVRATRRKAWK